MKIKKIFWETSSWDDKTLLGSVSGCEVNLFEIRTTPKKRVKDIVQTFQHPFGLGPFSNSSKKIQEVRLETGNEVEEAKQFCQDIFDNLAKSMME